VESPVVAAAGSMKTAWSILTNKSSRLLITVKIAVSVERALLLGFRGRKPPLDRRIRDD
jgi:hypothetical protein